MSSMSDRDRKLLLAIIPIVVIVGYWFLLLGPKRNDASTAAVTLAKQEKRRDAAKAELAQAAGAKTDFRSDYTQIVRLGKAIPAGVDMPSLIVQLEGAAKGTGIRFTKIAAGDRTPVAAAPAETAGSPPPAGSDSGTTPAAQAGGQPAQSAPGQAAEGANNTAAQANNAAAQSGVDATTSTTAREGGLPIGGGAATGGTEGAAPTSPAGLETVPLELEFTGDFFRLADFFHDIKRFVHVVNEDVVVNGRLVTIESVNYTSDPLLFPRLRAQITATVYLSPKTEGATAGATPQGPAATPTTTTPTATPAPAPSPSPAPTATATP
jgi:Tfp pilus assembly protein PilO